MPAHKRKQAPVTREQLDEAADLEALLFNKDRGGAQLLGNELGTQSLADLVSQLARPGGGAAAGGLLAAEDRAGDPALAAGAPAAAGREAPPVWEDPADAAVRVDIAAAPRLRKLREAEGEAVLDGGAYEARLRQQHRKLHPHTEWADIAAGGAADAADEEGPARLLSRGGKLLAPGGALPPGQLETSRLRDANAADPAAAAVRSVEFHPNGQLLLAAGLDKRVRFFSVDGGDNPLVQSVFFDDMPVHAAAFVSRGAAALAAGRRRFFYHLDLGSGTVERVAGLFGRDERSWESFAAAPAAPVAAFFGAGGAVPLVSLASRQVVATLKAPGSVRAGAFSADGAELATAGGDGAVCVWDLRTRRCRARFADEGSTGGAALAWSPDGALLASGQRSGVVNVYRAPWAGAGAGGGGGGAPAPLAAPAPAKSLPHLTTAADTLAFGAGGALLAVGSRLRRDALRLVHTPSMTVYANWPTSRTPLHYVHAAAFSPGGGYLAVGNAKGRVLLYRLHHFPQA